MKVAFVLLSSLRLGAGFPGMMGVGRNSSPKPISKRTEPSVRQPLFLSKRPNTGITNPHPTFNATAQFVDVGPHSGHEFQAPGPNDRRGPCPGLNAAANHGFIPHNGILTAADGECLESTTAGVYSLTIVALKGLDEAFNVGPTFSVGASAVGVVYAGDFLTGTWSIGGKYPGSVPLLTDPPGLLGTHSKYEADGSPTRGDAYLNGGNVDVLDMNYFAQLYNLGTEYTHDIVAAHAEYCQAYSKANNPYFFLGPIGAFLSPGTNGLIINMMSNHSADIPGGTLTRDVLKSFYSVTGEPGSFVYKPGYERIPDNWYKRPDSFGLEDIGSDAQMNNLMYPGQISLGGNTGKVNTFTGVDPGNLTGGVFNAANLFQGNNLACFVLQATQQAVPGQFSGLLGNIGDLVKWLADILGPITKELGCPQLDVFRKEMFAPFPGAESYLH
ncbi:uncharacterized protein N0V89_004774 [Didymosphaeria variabile]|uniref:Heme haloperoxidase family profile domain-containing protein n=1 Tax=Didymosphaeria variabile TaxID=1932322 RepID=A0A9W9CDK2_9PLEO|nr:uncharacterized protein N0V89_004774 [Didymosphaeria variabile]KAJ4356738.1 hypothetical protein N0V89_004774 [Didymosphaeria variabile]